MPLASNCSTVCTPVQLDDRGARRDFVQEPMKLENGYLALPTAPGLAIELNEEAFEHYPYRPWRRGMPLREDGSMAFI